jgi:CRP/FNR family transcriptional regulator
MLSDTQQSELLAAYPVLQILPSWLWQVVASEGKVVKLAAGAIAFDDESPCESYLMVTSGMVRVVKPVINGRELLLYRVQPGESCILTVSCLLGDCPYQARGIIESDVACVIVPRSVFLKLVEQSPEFRTFIFRFFGERATLLMELIEAVAFRKLDRRLAEFLRKKGPVIEITHQSLADELGSVREVISRILEDFRARGMVQLDRGQINVLDVEALERFEHQG